MRGPFGFDDDFPKALTTIAFVLLGFGLVIGFVVAFAAIRWFG